MEFKKVLTKKKWIIISILLILAIANPDMKDFKDYTGAESYSDLTKKYEFVLFSEYNYEGDNYIGVLFNFFKLPDLSK